MNIKEIPNLKNYIIKNGVGGRSKLIYFDNCKFVIKKSKSIEINFYKTINESNNKSLIKFKTFIPKPIIKYFNKDNLVMKNIFYNKNNFDIIDLKWGRFTKTIFGNYKKQKSKIRKSTISTSHEFGFRIDGCHFNLDKNNLNKCINLSKKNFINIK